MENPSDQIDKVLKGETSMASALGLPASAVEVLAIVAAQCYEQGRYEDARCIFKGVALLDPAGYYGHAGLGAIELMQENYDAALEHLNQAYRLNSKDPAVCGNLGEVYLRKGQLQEAIRCLKEADALDPGHVNPYANRARGILRAVQPPGAGRA
jgi:tetratricopeptide (TPR) repeat protein